MRRETCSACGHDELTEFLDLDTSPVADAYAATAEESLASKRYPLQVAVCGRCYLVQLMEVLPGSQLFGTGYSFYTSASPPLSRYHEKYAQDVLAKHPDLAGKFVLEVGCNDGDLLRHFQLAGCRTLGVDPATGPVGVARERGLDVRVRPFGARFAQDLHDVDGPANLVLANHVLAHVEDVSDMLAGVSTMLAWDGVAMVEVQYLPDMLVNNAFDLVYHEHRNFFSLTSLESAALRHGLHLHDVEFTMRQGGSLRATFVKGNVVSEAGNMVVHTERWLQTPGPYEGFQGRVNRIRERLWDLVVAEGDRVIAGYGAPAKATTLLNWCRMSGVLDHVIDTTPAKQGRYIPGTDIKIVNPDSEEEGFRVLNEDGGLSLYGVDTYMLLAHNYLPEILNKEKDFAGRWIVPIPAPMVF